jgi:hypothetical protein
MRRFIALALLVGAVLALPATMSGAAGDVPRGLVCADVIGGNGNTLGASFIAILQAPPCSFGGGQVSYTFEVFSDQSMGTRLSSTTTFAPIPDTNAIVFGLTGDADNQVCVVLTTRIANHVIDRAPDAGCLVVTTAGPGLGDFS